MPAVTIFSSLKSVWSSENVWRLLFLTKFCLGQQYQDYYNRPDRLLSINLQSKGLLLHVGNSCAKWQYARNGKMYSVALFLYVYQTLASSEFSTTEKCYVHSRHLLLYYSFFVAMSCHTSCVWCLVVHSTWSWATIITALQIVQVINPLLDIEGCG